MRFLREMLSDVSDEHPGRIITHLIPKWRKILYSFAFMLIGFHCFVFKPKILLNSAGAIEALRAG